MITIIDITIIIVTVILLGLDEDLRGTVSVSLALCH